jgi:hypothetical protein
MVFIANFGRFYCLDLPGILKTELIKDMEGYLSPTKANYIYAMMYSGYHIPVTFMIMFIGIAVDVFGCKLLSLPSITIFAIGNNNNIFNFFFSYCKNTM